MEPALQRKLEELPADPGCYLMKDRAGEVVYVGKAGSLRARVRSYFDRSGDERYFVPLLDDLLGDLEVIVTRSEKEAVLLENELIKRHRPRFNVRLRDDKDFIALRLDERHPFPRLEVIRARQRRDDGARYFGPYSSASSIRETLRVVNRWFQLRTCTDHVLDHRQRPCILYQIHRCPAPCVYEVPPEGYRESVRDAVAFLEGRESELVPRLRERMQAAAGALRFEEAARVRDQLGAVERSLETQRVLMGDLADRDAIGLHREGPDLVLQVLSMRGGRLQESRAFPFGGQEFPSEELLSSFLGLHYEGTPPPEEILLPLEPTDADAVAEVLSERRGRRVRLVTPQRGAKADLLEVARRNAAQSFRHWREDGDRREEALAALARALHLSREPRWMECYDISTFQGSLSVGSGVSMRDGEADRASYRRYRVKGVAGQDDFAMLHEVVTRRLRRALAEGAFPDLIVIDGGKGQLNAALAAARDLGVATRPVPGNPGVPWVELVSLAKARTLDAAALGTTRVVGRRSARGAHLAAAAERAERGFVAESARTPERVFLPGRKDPVVLRQNSAELFLLVRLRDEAHRFAVEFHRKLRRARNLRSVLEEIPGVGEGKRKSLLRHFGSLRKVREASPEEIARVPGFGAAQARAVHDFLRRPDAEPVAGPPGAGVPPARDGLGGRSPDTGAAPPGAAHSRFRPSRPPVAALETPMTRPPADAFDLAPVVAALCRDAAPILAGHRRMVLPSRERVLELVEGIRSVFFPGYFGEPDLRQEPLAYHVGSALARVARTVEEEVCRAVAFDQKHDHQTCAHCAAFASEVTGRFLARLPAVRARVASDVEAAYEGDPALKSRDEAIFAYPGIFAVTNQRIAHELHVLGVPLIPRIITEHAHTVTGIDIHPGASIGERFFIDHGTGVVIGETSRIGDRVRLYQGVTLGAKSFPLDENGKPIKGIDRHPIVEDDVVIYAGATILGRIVIGKGSSIGGNVWLTHEVPPGSKVSQEARVDR